MPVTDEQFAQLDARVTRLERAQNDTTESLRWSVTKLARIQAVQDEHTLRLERMEETQGQHTTLLLAHSRTLDEHTRALEENARALGELKAQFDAQAQALPRLIAETMREVLDERDRRRR